MDGPGKFVLGPRSVFTQDWGLLPRAKTVFICEGIIDYLSIKTLEEEAPPGLALLGNDVGFDPALLGSARHIISALDQDRGGYSALLDLLEQFSDTEIKVYDLEDHKDPNEFLMAVRSFKGRRLSPERKLKLYQEFLQSANRAELARKWGLDRSYMYDIVRECEKNMVDSFLRSKPGRKPEGKPSTLEEAWERIEELENSYEREATERELLYCRSEFLKLRLKWAEIEAAELRGEVVDDSKGLVVKKQIKKEKKEIIELLDHIHQNCQRVPLRRIISQCVFSRSQIYEWRRGVQERKQREPKMFPEKTVENAVAVIMNYPHMGGRKGQVYMLYHRLGYISTKVYDQVKKSVKRLLFQEVTNRGLLPPRTRYEHKRPERIGQIWAEDFTEVIVYGQTFKASLLIDVASQYYLGVAVSKWANAALVEKPVNQALAKNGGNGPKEFLLSDNGSPYVSDEHGKLLDKADIVHKRIPPLCSPIQWIG